MTRPVSVMRTEYDFSQARRNPWAGQLDRPIAMPVPAHAPSLEEPMPAANEARNALHDLEDLPFTSPEGERPADYPADLPFVPGLRVRWRSHEERALAQWALDDQVSLPPGFIGAGGLGSLVSAMLGIDAPTTGERDRLEAMTGQLTWEAEAMGWGVPETGDFPMFRAATVRTFKDGNRRLLLFTLPILGQCSVIAASGEKSSEP